MSKWKTRFKLIGFHGYRADHGTKSKKTGNNFGKNKKIKENVISHSVCLAGSPNSCVIKIENQKYRALVDSGASISVLSPRVIQKMKFKPKLVKKQINLHSVDGTPLAFDGCANIKFKIGGNLVEQTFHVSPSVTRNVILGRDWLLKFGVRLYYDIPSLKVKNTYIPLCNDIHIANIETEKRLTSLRFKDSYVSLDDDSVISSLLRLTRSEVLKPQSVTKCLVKIRTKLVPNLKTSEIFIQDIDRGFLHSQPGLLVYNGVARVRNGRAVVYILNQSGKFVHLKNGTVVSRGEGIVKGDIHAIDAETAVGEIAEMSSIDTAETPVDAPAEFLPLVRSIIGRNRDVFATKDSELGRTNATKMVIDTQDCSPIRLRPYKTPLNKRKIIEEAVSEMLDAKVIERSNSPWSFPMVIVKKSDGTNRPCIDYRKLNDITRKNSYPLPSIDFIIGNLGKAKYFTTLDLKSGFWQVQMDEKSKPKTAFACHKGLFQFNVMPFGLCNAPAVFQELMSVVLQGCEEFATAYIDDILIWSPDAESHRKHIQIVMNRIRQHNLRLKLKKCSFFKSETAYLGFTISDKGVQPDPKKVKVIQALSSPRTVREIRSFIGMAGYYRRFIPKFSHVAEPLIALTKKNARFRWSKECEQSFEILKGHLATLPLLAYPDPNKPYILYTDASDSCIGACLTQPSDDKTEFLPNCPNEKPLFFLSHKLSDTQSRWSVIEKEAYAIYFALQKLDPYLHGAEFEIRTDHQPLQSLLKSPINNKKIQLWALSIAGYNAKIRYVKGSLNECADMLSRINHHEADATDVELLNPDISDKTYEVNMLNSGEFDAPSFMTSRIPDEDLKLPDKNDDMFPQADMVTEQSKCTDITRIKSRLAKGTAKPSETRKHIIVQDIVYYISDPDNSPTLRLYVPSHLRLAVLKHFHNLGHYGIDRMFATIKPKYYWPNLFKDIHQYNDACIPCKERNMKQLKAELQSTGLPPFPFAKIGVDVSGPYPTSLSGNKYIIGFIDLYSGYPEAFPVKEKTSDNVCHLLLEEIFPRYGCPLVLISDNGKENIAKNVQETLAYMGIKHITTAYYHPQSNARIERFHKTLHNILSKRIDNSPDTWDVYLNQALAAVRFMVSDTAQHSPFFLLFNRDVVLPIDNILRPRRKYMGSDLHEVALQIQHQTFLQLHKNVEKARARQAKYANKNATQVQFQVGDPVYLKNHNPKGKLDRKWIGFFRIIDQTGPVSFIIKDQLTGNTRKTHANDIRLANVDQWKVPEPTRPIRSAQLVEAPESKESSSGSSSGNEEQGQGQSLADRFRNERTASSSEDPIPLSELRKRIRQANERSQDAGNEGSEVKSELQDPLSLASSQASSGNYTDEPMSVGEITRSRSRSKRMLKRKVRDRLRRATC